MQEIKWAYSWGHSQHLGQDIRVLYPPGGLPRYVVKGVLAFGDGVNHALSERMKDKDK
jgi:hypothetical protein